MAVAARAAMAGRAPRPPLWAQRGADVKEGEGRTRRQPRTHLVVQQKPCIRGPEFCCSCHERNRRRLGGPCRAHVSVPNQDVQKSGDRAMTCPLSRRAPSAASRLLRSLVTIARVSLLSPWGARLWPNLAK
jgi:hypothetical protein